VTISLASNIDQTSTGSTLSIDSQLLNEVAVSIAGESKATSKKNAT
jgi:hypothetical protein